MKAPIKPFHSLRRFASKPRIRGVSALEFLVAIGIAGIAVSGITAMIGRTKKLERGMAIQESLEAVRNTIRLGLDCEKTIEPLDAGCPVSGFVELKYHTGQNLVGIPGTLPTQIKNYYVRSTCVGAELKTFQIEAKEITNTDNTWVPLFPVLALTCKGTAATPPPPPPPPPQDSPPAYAVCNGDPQKGLIYYQQRCPPGTITIMMNDGAQFFWKFMTCCPPASATALSTVPAEVNVVRSNFCGANEVQTGVKNNSNPISVFCTKINTADYHLGTPKNAIRAFPTTTALTVVMRSIISMYNLQDACSCLPDYFMAGGHTWIDDTCKDRCYQIIAN